MSAHAPVRLRALVRPVLGAAVLTAVVVRVGGTPFVHALASVRWWTVAVALLLTLGATTTAVWRWRAIAERLGVGLPWRRAMRMSYRAQFLNAVLPGGVLGDVDRAVVHGRDGDRSAAARAVIAERVLGQAVQITVTLVVLAWVSAGPFAAAGVVLVAALAGWAVRWIRPLRHVVGHGPTAGRLVVASVAIVSCHVALLVTAAFAVGVRTDPARLVVVALVVLVAAAVPLNVGGWGPREGAAAWAFGAAGLDPVAGVAASALFGVLVTIAVAPGAVALLPAGIGRRVRSVRHGIARHRARHQVEGSRRWSPHRTSS